ncbi:MAG: hypothetical protein U0932_01010 [Thiobacillus sp.]|nr:hypothetical protein [Thiobacillus sp.]
MNEIMGRGEMLRAAIDEACGDNVHRAYGYMSAMLAGLSGPVRDRKLWRDEVKKMETRGAEILKIEGGKP